MPEDTTPRSGAAGDGGEGPKPRRGRRRKEADAAAVPPELVTLVRTRVEQVLKERGIRKVDLARALAIGQGHLWALLSGTISLSLSWINRIAAVLEVPPAFLLSQGEPDVLIALTRRPMYRHLAEQLTRLSDDQLTQVLRFVIESEGAGQEGKS